jgi:dsRNA-specific ribonuclease
MDRYAQFALGRGARGDRRREVSPTTPTSAIARARSSPPGSAASSPSRTRPSRSPRRSVGSHLAVLRSDADGQRGGGPDLDEHGLRGPVFAVASACASANDALSVAFDKIALGDAIAVVTGGSEATVIPTAMGGFDSMKALSTRNDEPTKASVAPFDRERDGFRARRRRGRAGARGARVCAGARSADLRRDARLRQSADAYNIAQPDPESGGVDSRDQRALASAGMRPSRSATSTRTARRRRSATPPNRRRSSGLRRAREHAARWPSARRSRCTDTRSARPVRSKGVATRARDLQRDHSADDQLRSSPTPSARSTTYRTSRARPRSPSRCRTGSASAVTTRPSSSVNTTEMAGERRRARLRALLKMAGIGDVDPARIERAFVHASAGREQLLASNERLEFFGDAILGFVASRWLMTKYPDATEGDVDAAQGERSSAARRAPKRHAGSGSRRSRRAGPRDGAAAAARQQTILADAFEAFLAALYEATDIAHVERFLEKRAHRAGRPRDAGRARRQDRAAGVHASALAATHAPMYFERAEGPPNDRRFTSQVRVGDESARRRDRLRRRRPRSRAPRRWRCRPCAAAPRGSALGRRTTSVRVIVRRRVIAARRRNPRTPEPEAPI